VTDCPTEQGVPLDGMVGGMTNYDVTSTSAMTDTSRIRVFVSGAGVSEPGAMGLDEDLRLLVQAFIRGSHCSDEGMAAETSASSAGEDIKIALHGLNLAPEQERELKQLIRELVRKRVANKGAIK
jgi:hypothetical protein